MFNRNFYLSPTEWTSQLISPETSQSFTILPYYHLVLSAAYIINGDLGAVMEKLLGSSRVQPNFRVTLIRKVRRKLEVKEGDTLAFYEDERGNITIKRVELKPY